MQRVPGLPLTGLLLLTLVLVLTLACQQPAAPARVVTATPDIPATVAVLAQAPTAAAVPSPAAPPTPDTPATVAARVQATLAAIPTALPESAPTLQPTPTYPPTYTPQPTHTPFPTYTPQPTYTPFPIATPTSTPTPPPTATPTLRPTPTPLPSLTSDPDLVIFGPESGKIGHEPGNRFLEAFGGAPTDEDVVVEATFHNPYPTGSAYWEHGFLLRDGSVGNYHHFVSINSYGNWTYFHRVGEIAAQGRRSERSPAINTSPRGKNTLAVVMIGPDAWLYVNGKYQARLDFSAITEGGDIQAFVVDDSEGETRFENFTIWKWGPSLAAQLPAVRVSPTPTPAATPNPRVPVYGPESGVIEHQPADDYLEVFPGPVVSGDVMIEVTFHNPYAPRESHWNYGLFFDSAQRNAWHWIEISSRWGWVQIIRSGEDQDVQLGRWAKIPGLNVSGDGRNHIRFILIDDTGYLYINDRFMGNLNFDLGDVPNPDRIGLVVDDSTVYGHRYEEGDKTRFEDFTIWKWHPDLYNLPEAD